MLGSINLAAFVDNGKFDFFEFGKTIAIAVKSLNDVLDEGLPLHPLQEQRDSVRDWRQIGLGIMGLADCFIKMNIPYGSTKSIEMSHDIGGYLAYHAMLASAALAHDECSYVKCNNADVVKTEFFKANAARQYSNDVIESVGKYGLRNSQLLTCAPTGTLSTMLGISGGIEPIFANYYTRKTQSLHGKDVEYKVYTKIVDDYMKANNITDDKDLPDYFVTAQQLDYKARIDVQAAWQAHIDASISSTVNLPNTATVEDVEKLYIYAWEQGLKGVTIYRAGCKREGILTTEDTTQEEHRELDCIIPVSRSVFGKTIGTTNKYKAACGALYITINRDDSGNIVETFVNVSKNGICKSNIDGISRTISVALRSGTAVEEVVDQLKGINCAACSRALAKGEKLDGISCPDIIAKAIQSEYDSDEIYIRKTKRGKGKKRVSKPQEKSPEAKCEECGGGIKFEGGCVVCTSCGWSRCS